MAMSNLGDNESLQVIPKDTLIQARRVSQGGELTVVDNPCLRMSIHPWESIQEKEAETEKEKGLAKCASTVRKGRSCTLGPLSAAVDVTRLSFKGKPPTKEAYELMAKKSVMKEYVHRLTQPCPLFPLEADKVKTTRLDSYLSEATRSENRLAPPQPDAAPLGSPKKLSIAEIVYPPPFPLACDDLKRVMEEAQKKYQSCAAHTRKLYKKEPWRSKLPVDLSSVPLHTLLVRWRLLHNLPCYTMDGVYRAMSRIGPVVSLGQLSANSALVLYNSMESATRAVELGRLGNESYPLVISFWHTNIYRDRFRTDLFPCTKKRTVVTEEEILARRFYLIQSKVITCLKLRKKMSYDYRHFIE